MTTLHFDLADGAGNVEIDLAKRIPRRLGTVAISGGASGTITDAELLNGEPWWGWVSNRAISVLDGYINVSVNISGDTLSYSFAPVSHTTAGAAAVQVDGTLIYGTY